MPYASLTARRKVARESAARRRVRDPQGRRDYLNSWRNENKEKTRSYKRIQKQNDVSHRLLEYARTRIWCALKKNCKSARTVELLGCSIVSWKAHLESLFVPGMTWENYGPVWHVDHIKPCSKFDHSNPEQQKLCFHWSNTQPLFSADNLAKGDR